MRGTLDTALTLSRMPAQMRSLSRLRSLPAGPKSSPSHRVTSDTNTSSSAPLKRLFLLPTPPATEDTPLFCSMERRSSEDMPGAMMLGWTTTTLKGSPLGSPLLWSQLPSESSSSLGKPSSETAPPKGPSGDSTLMCMGGDCSYSSPPSS